jgi:hypothetical protein
VIRLIFFASMAARPAGRPSTARAIASALGIAIAGAVVWGLVARLFNVQLSLIGVLIGAGVGYAVARYRPGHLPTIAAGVVIAVFGCALGTFLALVFSLLGDGFALGDILSHLSAVFRAYPSAVGGFGLFFWLVAGFAAYRVPAHSQRMAARTGAAPPPGYGSPSGYGTPSGYGAPGSYGAAAGGFGTAADGTGPQPGGQAPDAGLPPFTGPAGPPPPGSGEPV